MMELSVRAGAGPGSRPFCAAGRLCRVTVVTMLVASAGTGCSSDPGAELPFKPCGVEERFFGDEVTLSFVHRSYDERGNHVLSERDHGVDGSVDDRFVWQYGPGGELTLITQSFSSGTMREVVVEHDDDGRLAFVTWTTSSGEAGRADYEYDGEQRIIEHWDRDDDGVAEENVTYTYDADGKLRESAFRCAGDVEPRSITTMTWGQGGRIERIEIGLDGEVSAATQFTYGQDGLLERWERSLLGTVTISETFEFDAEGNVAATSLASLLVLGQDPPSWSVTDTAYDADGRVLGSTNGVDGQLFSENTYLYECPDHEDSPGRHVGAPGSPLPAPPTGPRGGVGLDAIITYALGGGSSCPSPELPTNGAGWLVSL